MVEDIPIEHLHERLDFDSGTGVFTWKFWPDAWKGWNERFAGVEAFPRPGKKGYRTVDLRVGPGGPRFAASASQVAWAMHYGAWPEHVIHHRNGCRSDDRISNLIDQPQVLCSRSMRRPRTNTSGIVGVTYVKRDKCYRAQINVNGKGFNLGSFQTREAAKEARASANLRFGFAPSHGRECS